MKERNSVTITLRWLLVMVIMVTLCGRLRAGNGQEGQFRPPAVPLVTCDPYFSIWSFNDRLTDDWTKHWTGATHAMSSMVRIDGTPFRVMGPSPRSVAAMPQRQLEVTPTRTMYTFDTAGIRLSLTFLTPMIPTDLELLSRPITYVIWEMASTDGKNHDVAIYFDHSAELVVNTVDQKVVWSRAKVEGLEVLRVGSQDQRVLERSGDDLRIDWGYCNLILPRIDGAQSVMADHSSARKTFAEKGTLPASDDLRMPRAASDQWPVMAAVVPAGQVGAAPVSRHIMLGYDDRYSIEYFERKLRPYWTNGGVDWSGLIAKADKEYPELLLRAVAFDKALMTDLEKAGGKQYAQIAALAYRQCLAAQKLAVERDGTPLLFPKENFSNGCISTVDVLYPAAPMLLFLNTGLLRASLTPVMEYAESGRWRFPFAPHDLGTYPLANGQVYGGGEKTEENQMPVEESGNMILLIAAMARIDGNAAYAERYWPVLSRWAAYLREKGSDPENQLCTDDFAGHLAHNTNLSIKAILALDAYAMLCRMTGKKDEAERYHTIAKDFAGDWVRRAADGDHYRLAFDKPGTWSQKYNLVWDKVLGLNLFPDSVTRTEMRWYAAQQNRYGLPLDNRKEYTKLDWILWTASMAATREEFESFVSPVYNFLQDTPDRVPMTDWYQTADAKQAGFRARSVVGGVYMKMLTNEALWKHWASQAAASNAAKGKH